MKNVKVRISDLIEVNNAEITSDRINDPKIEGDRVFMTVDGIRISISIEDYEKITGENREHEEQ